MRETKEPGLDLGTGELWAASSRVDMARPTSQIRSSWLLLGVRVQRVCGQGSWLGGSEDGPDLVVEAKMKDGVRVTRHRCGDGLHVGGEQGKR